MSNAQEETLRQIAGTGPATNPRTLFAATTLPAAGALLGGIAVVPVPAGSTRGLVFVTYVFGTGGSAGAGGARVRVLIGAAAQDGDVFPYIAAPSTSTISALIRDGGAFFSFIIPPGITNVSVAVNEEGDTPRPGEEVAATISFS